MKREEEELKFMYVFFHVLKKQNIQHVLKKYTRSKIIQLVLNKMQYDITCIRKYVYLESCH